MKSLPCRVLLFPNYFSTNRRNYSTFFKADKVHKETPSFHCLSNIFFPKKNCSQLPFKKKAKKERPFLLSLLSDDDDLAS